MREWEDEDTQFDGVRSIQTRKTRLMVLQAFFEFSSRHFEDVQLFFRFRERFRNFPQRAQAENNE